MRVRKRPVEVEAEQWFANSGRWAKGVCADPHGGPISPGAPHVHTMHDNQVVYLNSGDWIVPEPDGEHYYPIKPDVFEATYDVVT